MDEKKEKALEDALKQIEKQFGKGTVMKLGSNEVVPVDVIPTGSISLDSALGIGGVPRGRIIEIYGQESSGKTTLALHIIAEAQKTGGNAAFIDAEHALDPIYASAMGVDVKNLLISQPDTGEQALEIAEMLVRSGAVDVVVIDSVAALVPRAEIEGEMGDSHMGLQARLMSQALRKLIGVVSKSSTCAVFINQVRYKIGVMFGSPMTTPGGLALKFHSTIRMQISKIGTIKKGEENTGMNVKVKVVKNKLAPPFKTATFDIIYGKGISKQGEIIDLGVEIGIIKRSGAWFTYGETRLGQGKENVRTFLENNPDIAQEIEGKIRDSGELFPAKEGVEKDDKEEQSNTTTSI